MISIDGLVCKIFLSLMVVCSKAVAFSKMVPCQSARTLGRSSMPVPSSRRGRITGTISSKRLPRSLNSFHSLTSHWQEGLLFQNRRHQRAPLQWVTGMQSRSNQKFLSFSPRKSTVLASQHDPSHENSPFPRSIAVIGGGLAGLATAHGLIEKAITTNTSLTLTILDTTEKPGMGGASAVAGG